MHIEILHVPDCPNLGLSRTRLSRALEETGITAPVREVVVADAEAAERLGMHGSPTILIDGRDPFGEGHPGASLSCRLYRSGRRLEGAPAVAALVEALAGPQ